jgi:hypothetical protein
VSSLKLPIPRNSKINQTISRDGVRDIKIKRTFFTNVEEKVFEKGNARSLIYLPIKKPIKEEAIITSSVRKKGKRESIL